MLWPTMLDLKHRMWPRYIGRKYSAKDMRKPETQGERAGHMHKPPEEAQCSNSCITESESWWEAGLPTLNPKLPSPQIVLYEHCIHYFSPGCDKIVDKVCSRKGFGEGTVPRGEEAEQEGVWSSGSHCLYTRSWGHWVPVLSWFLPLSFYTQSGIPVQGWWYPHPG